MNIPSSCSDTFDWYQRGLPSRAELEKEVTQSACYGFAISILFGSSPQIAFIQGVTVGMLSLVSSLTNPLMEKLQDTPHRCTQIEKIVVACLNASITRMITPVL